MKSYPTKFKSFLWKIVQMGTLQKLQNSIQTLLIFWPVYPIHTNSLFWVIFLELPFCHFPPPNTSIRGKDSKIQLIFHLNILIFQRNGKQLKSFPVLSRFCNGLLAGKYYGRYISSCDERLEGRLLFRDIDSLYFMKECDLNTASRVFGVLAWNKEVEGFILLLRNATMPCQETQFRHISSRSRECSVSRSGSEKYYTTRKISARIEFHYTIE